MYIFLCLVFVLEGFKNLSFLIWISCCWVDGYILSNYVLFLYIIVDDEFKFEVYFDFNLFDIGFESYVFLVYLCFGGYFMKRFIIDRLILFSL